MVSCVIEQAFPECIDILKGTDRIRQERGKKTRNGMCDTMNAAIESCCSFCFFFVGCSIPALAPSHSQSPFVTSVSLIHNLRCNIPVHSFHFSTFSSSIFQKERTKQMERHRKERNKEYPVLFFLVSISSSPRTRI